MLIRLENLSPSRFRGWLRTTTDQHPPFTSGHVGTIPILVGQKIGDVWPVEFRTVIDAGQETAIDLNAMVAGMVEVPFAPKSWDDEMGGPPLLNGAVALELQSIERDAASFCFHWQLRDGSFVIDLWLRKVPGEAWAAGEAMLTYSNPRSTQMTANCGHIRLSIGDGITLVPYRGANEAIFRPTRFADGQSMVTPIGVIWPRLITDGDWSSPGAIAHGGVMASGLTMRPKYPSGLVGGAPVFAAGFSAKSWAKQNWLATLGILLTWDHPTIGPAANTGQAGGQEDQLFVGFEGLVSPAAGEVRYFAALKTAQHPMHHREWDGRVVDGHRHPELRMFYSRPHSSGSDRLGKTRDLVDAAEPHGETYGWNGPDLQHHSSATLTAGARHKGSPAMQKLLEHHARNYLVGPSAAPEEVTSTIWSSRELGWEGLLVCNLVRALKDRDLAARVLAHYRERVERILINKLADRDIWVEVVDAPSVGPGAWWQLWQQAIGAYGVDVACELIGMPEGRAMALRAAKKVMDAGWVFENGRWVVYEHQRVDGSAKTRSTDTNFGLAWMPLAIAVVLRHEPQNERANMLWDQTLADSVGGEPRWLPPELIPQ